MTGWQTVKLQEVCSQDRRTIKAGECNDLRYIGLETIEANSGQFMEGELSKTPETPKANSFRFGKQHVLYGKLRPYLNKVALPDFEGKCSTEIIPLLPKNGIDRAYLAYFLRSPQIVSQITAKTAGSRMPRADMDFVLSLDIPLPPLLEQRRIVDILSRAEGIIHLRRQAQKKAAELISALFLDMFGDPATNPRGWPIVKLEEVLSESPTLGTMAKPSSNDGGWLDLRVANIQGGQLKLENRKWIDLPDQQVNRFSLRDGDVVLARAIGSLDHLGKAVIVYPGANKWTFDSHLMRIRLDTSRLIPEVFKSFLESKGGREKFLKHTRQSVVQFNINGKELRAISVQLPPRSLQQTFLEQTKNIDSIQDQQATATLKAEAIFDALLADTFNKSCRRGLDTG